MTTTLLSFILNKHFIGKLNYLDDVEVISIDGSWAKIEYGDKEAYVYAEYLNVESSNLVWLVLILLLAGLGGGAVVHLKKMAHQTCVINLIGDEFSL